VSRNLSFRIIEFNEMNVSEFKKLSSVSFFCPAYNDADNLPILIPHVNNFLSDIAEIYEILIIEDGSPDKTGAVADQLAQAYQKIRVIHHLKNQGYGATLRDGFMNAKYDFIIYTDGDNQYDIYDLKPYLPMLAESDVLAGYAKEKAVSRLRKIQSFIFNLLVTILFFVNFKDIDCALKVFKKEVLKSMRIQSTSSFIDAEMLIKAKQAGYKISQFPVHHFPRKHGIASGAKVHVITATISEMLMFRLGRL
jgi:glycosyltransferase involved in cell wall biosynthesis